MTQPKVQILVSLYKPDREMMRKQFRSLNEQTYGNLEIIVVDDGSTDGSGAVCDEYLRDPRVKVIHQENQGLSKARNTGLDLMTGRYTAFLDPDDALCPEAIEQLLGTIVRHGADLAVCGYDVCNTGGPLPEAGSRAGTLPDHEVLTSGEALVSAADGAFSCAAWGKLYQGRLWSSLRFPEGRVFEDLLVLPDVLEQCGRIAVNPRVLWHLRKREGSITVTRTVQTLRDHIDALRLFGEYVKKALPSLPPERLRVYRERALRVLVLSWSELLREKAPPDIMRGLRKEILEFAGKDVRFQWISSKIYWRLFLFFPGILPPFRMCCRRIRHIAEKAKPSGPDTAGSP